MAAKIVLTFDNLGEASELERGTWTAGQPLGRHPSVTIALPRLLDELGALGLRATFFVEGINAELNPEAVREIVARGHELGAHGWRHEHWSELGHDRELELLDRIGDGFGTLGVRARGFRPPGGMLSGGSSQLLIEHGYDWCSPASGTFRIDGDGLAYLPFEWEAVDAYHLMSRFASLRVTRGHGSASFSASDTATFLREALVSPEPSEKVLILHPFLMVGAEWWEYAKRLLRTIAQLSQAGEAWVGPGGTFVDSLSAEPKSGQL
jgi:peptidoglycan/xylan/chitin deacetylase (PgdA/CDA1 family)